MAMVVLILFTRFPKVELKEDEKVGTKENYLDLFKNRYVILFFLGIFATRVGERAALAGLVVGL
ncbi:MAG: hypothetical protein OQK69_11345, partial [Gammaproteobacteria bacterium]|nr:hypothetical protein [Gammaproteobacteria bacterium]